MSLETGTKLGPYEILVPLGAGGMGEEGQSSVISRSEAARFLSEMYTIDVY